MQILAVRLVMLCSVFIDNRYMSIQMKNNNSFYFVYAHLSREFWQKHTK